MRIRAICAFVCLVLVTGTLQAQRYSFKHYDQNSGLANQDIRALFQDRAGFVWIGTENGLYRYDGHRFEAFTEAEGLPTSRVEAIHQTGDGTLWVATRSGLARLKGQRFEKVDISPANDTFSVTSDAHGRLFLGTTAGLLVSGPLDASRPLTFHRYANTTQKLQRALGSAISPAGTVWYGCGTQICRLEGEHVESLSVAQGVPEDFWEALLIDSQGSVWARSLTKLIELPKGASMFVRRENGLPDAALDGRLLLGRDGQLWVPTLRGLARRTASGWEIIGKSRGLPMSSVSCALEDREGSIWIGLNGDGLARWLGSPHWETWTEAEGLSSENVWGIMRDRGGVLWSVDDIGVSRFHQDRNQWDSLKIRGLSSGQTTHIGEASDGTFWVSQRAGPVHIDLKRGTATQYGTESGLESPWVTALAVGAPGTIWAGTKKGLFQGETHGGTTRFHREELPGERSPDYVLQEMADRQGRIWVATWAGLLRLEDGRWTRLTTSDGLLSDHVTYLTEGIDGSLWIGYFEPVGISQMTGKDEARRWRHFSHKDGLQSDKAFFLGSDVRGWIWFGTDKGVEVYDGVAWRHFDQTDGLEGAASSFWSDTDGSVWLGTSKGIAHLRIPGGGLPARLTSAPTLLTSVVFGDRNVSLDREVSVPWSQRSLNVGFAAMTFVNEDTVQFRYRVAGLDKDWTETPLREVHISSLPAGHYTLEVEANVPGANPSQKAWDSAAATVGFTIKPAWWFTWWFILLALTTTALITYLVWTWRVRSMLRRQRELEDAVSDRTRKLNLEKAHAERERDTVEKQKIEIEHLFQQSQQAARLKDEFLANMSHEIRTPMNGIIGMTQLVLDSELSNEQREHLEIVDRSADSLLAIVNDILDLSKIEAGKLDLDEVVMDPHLVVAAALKIVMLRATEKHLKLSSFIDANVPHSLIGDPLRLRQVLLNLLGNAIKFTEQGEVKLLLKLEGDANSPTLHFEIADTGIGIPREKHALIFEPFSQSDGSHTRRYGGTGLGLTICARFVKMMGGRLWVESELGQGSRFHFTTQVQRAPEPVAPFDSGQSAGSESTVEVKTAAGELVQLAQAIAPSPVTSPSMTPTRGTTNSAKPESVTPATGTEGSKEISSVKPKSILLAEDNPVNQKLAAKLLRKRGHSVVIASNGKEAVAAYERETFDVVLMDVQMPEMDGVEATAQIRERERLTGTHIPIVAFTAHVMSGDRETYLQAGMDDYVSKPINPVELFAAVENGPAALQR